MESFTEEPSWFIVILGIVICWAPVAPADAAGDLQPGCEKLAAAVAASVAEALDGSPPPANAVSTGGAGSLPEPVARCATVTATASEAFMRAVRARGVAARWQGDVAGGAGAARAGDYRCAAQGLGQCVPHLAGGGLDFSGTVADRVAETWAGIRAALRQVMPFGAHSDLAWFHESRLRAALRSRMHEVRVMAMRLPGSISERPAGAPGARPVR